ncbi:MAG TPA: ZIP family metal transporter [Candidatus Bathyarchaeia archaeon]|nr:ZIP family metal transporter [Candidatus Bathyarchaeia archaeon]
MDSVFEPFLLSLIAGTATGIGGIIVLPLRRVSDRVVSFSLGLASGVMLLVAFNNLFLEAAKLLAHIELIIMFSLGALTMIGLDLTIPHIELATGTEDSRHAKMLRTGELIAIGITLHNFPEGFVVAAGYTYMPRLGLIITAAIMLHNIPEGVATAILFTKAGMKPFKIAVLTFLSGLAEPVAALVGTVALSLVGTKTIVGLSLVFAAGVMTYITADELIPVAHEYGYKHTVSVSLLLGIILALMIDVILS